MINFTDLLLEIVHPHQLWRGMYLFLLAIAGLVLFIAFYMVKRGALSARRRRLRQQFSDFISELAICDTEEECTVFVNSPATKQLQDRWLSDRFARNTLIRELTAVAKNMSGQATANICWYYEKADLYADTLKHLKSKQWHVKARAIQQLAHLQQSRFARRIYRLTNDKHELVRNEARIAMVKLTGFKGLRFLHYISYPITDWQQISLLHELAQHRRIAFPSLQELLQSANTSVVEFTLRLIASYQQFELKDAVVKCLQSPEPAIREKALIALMEIGDETSVEAILQNFHKEDPRLQLLSLQVIQKTGASGCTAFLLSLLCHPDHEIKAASARAILEWEPDGQCLIAERVPTDAYPWNQLLPQLKQEKRA